MTVSRQRLIAVSMLGLALVIGWFAYAPALGGAYLLDDVSNLGGLKFVEDSLSALVFIFSGEAGPLGRPLALATFVPQAAAWGGSAEPFLTVNILIHLANACLLAWVLYRLSVAARLAEDKALFVAVAGTAIWLFMPLLASSSLMIVQRMTTLSASFVLLGLAGYLQARQSLERSPARSLAVMSASLVAGSVLAVLAKENGVLLPTFVLAIEATILQRPDKIKSSHWLVWELVFLVLPTALIAVYIAGMLPYSEQLVLRRDFTGWERLLTQSRVLWEYLFYAFVPQPGHLGPFHDGYPVARSILDPVTFLAFSSWLLLLGSAVVFRRRYPLVAFAVLWFLAGHLIESTVVSLELYFEHRNYLPLIGPVFALCVLMTRIPVARRALAWSGVAVYVLINAIVLFGVTSLWGNPAVAAWYWAEQFPDSTRAATTVAKYWLEVEGPQGTLESLRKMVQNHPEAGFVKIQELNLSCMIAPRKDHRELVAELSGLLKEVDFSSTAGTMLSQLFTTVSQVECNGVDNDTVRMLARVLLDNPRYKNGAAYNRLHHQLMARISRQEGHVNQTIRHLEQSLAYGRTSELNMMMVTTFADAGKFESARVYIDEARQKEFWHPMKAWLWQRDLDGLTKYIDEVERYVESNDEETSSTATASEPQ